MLKTAPYQAPGCTSWENMSDSIMSKQHRDNDRDSKSLSRGIMCDGPIDAPDEISAGSHKLVYDHTCFRSAEATMVERDGVSDMNTHVMSESDNVQFNLFMAGADELLKDQREKMLGIRF